MIDGPTSLTLTTDLAALATASIPWSATRTCFLDFRGSVPVSQVVLLPSVRGLVTRLPPLFSTPPHNDLQPVACLRSG